MRDNPGELRRGRPVWKRVFLIAAGVLVLAAGIAAYRKTFGRMTVCPPAAGTSVGSGPVPVAGTAVAYDRTASATVGGRTVPLTLTGVGLRTRFGVHVYAVASYVQDGTRVTGADDVLDAGGVRMLHLVMQRTVGAGEFLNVLRKAVGARHPGGRFDAEFDQLAAGIGEHPATAGDHVTLVSVPGDGVRVRMGAQAEVAVPSPAFAQALWELYLGNKPLDEGLKQGLASIPTP